MLHIHRMHVAETMGAPSEWSYQRIQPSIPLLEALLQSGFNFALFRISLRPERPSKKVQPISTAQGLLGMFPQTDLSFEPQFHSGGHQRQCR